MIQEKRSGKIPSNFREDMIKGISFLDFKDRMEPDDVRKAKQCRLLLSVLFKEHKSICEKLLNKGMELGSSFSEFRRLCINLLGTRS